MATKYTHTIQFMYIFIVKPASINFLSTFYYRHITMQYATKWKMSKCRLNTKEMRNERKIWAKVRVVYACWRRLRISKERESDRKAQNELEILWTKTLFTMWCTLREEFKYQKNKLCALKVRGEQPNALDLFWNYSRTIVVAWNELMWAWIVDKFETILDDILFYWHSTVYKVKQKSSEINTELNLFENKKFFQHIHHLLDFSNK